MFIKEVSQQIGVNPQTIRQWITKFDLDVDVNSRGHRVFDESEVMALQYIKELMAQGETFQSAYNIFYCLDEPIKEKEQTNTTPSITNPIKAVEGDLGAVNNTQLNTIEDDKEHSTDINTGLFSLLLCNKKTAYLMLIAYILFIVGYIAKPHVQKWWQRRQAKQEPEKQDASGFVYGY